MADSRASVASAGPSTTFIPRPPPPWAALMATGQPNSSPKAVTWSAEVSTSERPGTPDTPARSAACRELILSPITSIASGGGPMKMTPSPVMARAKSVFSEKNP